MAHHCSYSASLKWKEDNSFYFEVEASWKDKKISVQKLFENGKSQSRYLYLTQMAGYLVMFPGEKSNSYYFGNTIQDEEDFGDEYKISHLLVNWTDSDSGLETIACRRPELKYLCRKLIGKDIDIYSFVKSVGIYVNDSGSNMEPLVQLGFIELAKNKNLWRMGEERRRAILKYIKNNLKELQEISNEAICGHFNMNFSLCEIQSLMKNPDIPPKEQLIESSIGLTHKEFIYCKKRKIEYSDYETYLHTVKTVGHNLNDDYWHYPNNYDRSLQKIQSEEFAINNARDLLKSSKFGNGIEAYKDLSERTSRILGSYLIYIPYKVKDIVNQANKLNQCLIRNDYVGKMANQDSVLVFIKDSKTNDPLATCEIDWNKNIIQIYGHEYGSDRDKSQASIEVKKAVNIYLSMIKIEKPEISHKFDISDDKNIYFKGVINSKSGALTDIFGKTEYKPGEIYDTGVSDKDFNASCKSSPKAIHFCKNIRRVDDFISGSNKYLIIQALGKVLHTGDEYFSNKIKVLEVVSI